MRWRARQVAGIVVSMTVLVACTQPRTQEEAAQPTDGRAMAAPVATPSAEADSAPTPQFNEERALRYTRSVVALGPRYPGSPGHKKTQEFLRRHLQHDHLETDSFTADTPGGRLTMTNIIAKFPGRKDGVIAIAGHYDTKRLKNFVGANDGGSSTGFLLELANQLRGQQRDGYSVWLVFLDGEEALGETNDMHLGNSLYGSRHLAERWRHEGVVKKLKAFLLVDMIGDADLNIDRDSNSTPWLSDLVYSAARRMGYQSHFYARELGMFDDHVPFLQAGVPAIDLIDFNYGYGNAFWHTSEDTLDKLSAKSFGIVGRVVLDTVRMLDSR